MLPQTKYIYKLFRSIYHQINHAKPAPSLNQCVDLSKSFPLTTRSPKFDSVCPSYALICATNKQHLTLGLLKPNKIT